MNIREQFVADVESFLLRHGMPQTSLGLKALNDGSFVTRLREGHDVRTRTMDRVRAYMRSMDDSLGAPRPRPRRAPTRASAAA